MPYYIKRKKSEKVGKAPKKRRSSLPTLVRKLDKVFSKYIRLRDSKAFGYRGFRCISCGQIKPISKADCGHYYSRAKMSVRFDEDNAHGECSFCNRFCADHLVGYRENLIKKIGQQRFDLLRVRANQTKKWSEFELTELIKYYTARVAEMEKEK